MTWLSSLHPYPAMIADPLAADLGARFVRAGFRVLDPFCGTGRTLFAAAQEGAYCVGVDVNPLAAVIMRAKAARVRIGTLEDLLTSLAEKDFRDCEAYRLEPGRKVAWFSSRAKRELSQLIRWLNRQPISAGERQLLAGILSATARDVSYCRKNQWKLHRMPAKQRSAFKRSAHRVFQRRLRKVVRELREKGRPPGRTRALIGDCRQLKPLLALHGEQKKFDVVITSPPYGDSRTTVAYGGMSSICLGVIRNLSGCNTGFLESGAIDRACLGGRLGSLGADVAFNDIKKYWNGGRRNAAGPRVLELLADLSACCNQVCSVLKTGGRTIFIVSRRSMGGWRLKLDRFIEDAMKRKGLVLEEKKVRRIAGKVTPFAINPRGRLSACRGRAATRVNTMRREYILVFRKGVAKRRS